MTYIDKEILKLKEEIAYYKNYQLNLKKFIFESISKNTITIFEYYILSEEVDRMAIKIKALQSIKNSFKKYLEI